MRTQQFWYLSRIAQLRKGATNNADPQIMADIKSNKMSCLTSGCHDQIHNVTKLSEVKYWDGK